MRISAKADYAVRAAAELAAAAEGPPIRAEQIAGAQHIPLNFLLNILGDMKLARIVQSYRGAQGGYRLARPPEEVTVADVIRSVEGPLANVHESRPEELQYTGAAEPLRDVWVAVRVNLRAVLESVTLADLAGGRLPEGIRALTDSPDAWIGR